MDEVKQSNKTSIRQYETRSERDEWREQTQKPDDYFGRCKRTKPTMLLEFMDTNVDKSTKTKFYNQRFADTDKTEKRKK